MKVIRILVYEGDKDFINASLAETNRAVLGVFKVPKGSISEFYLQTDPPIDFEPEKRKEK